ncbi:MAG TPA: HD domain-containing protein [Dehalococcoidia bacterium]|nr:HD domain-containing protein [Dehalococcoidia bacterium]
MSDYLIIPLVEVVLTLVLIVLLLVRGKQHAARRPFFFFLFNMNLWGVFIFLMRSSDKLSTALVWERFVFAAILIGAFFFYRFTISLTSTRPNRIAYYVTHAIFIIALCLVPTDFVVKDMQLMWYGKAPVVGPLFVVYIFSAYALLVSGLVILVKSSRRSSNMDEKTRIQYIVAGMVVTFIGGTTDYLPALGVSMYPLGIVGNIVFCALATVAMLRYNLLEMKMMLRKGLAYSLMGILLAAIFGSLIYLLSSVFETALSPISLTITIVSVILTIIATTLFQPMLPVFQNVVDRWFFRERYDHLRTLKRFIAETKHIIDLNQLTSSLVTSIANGMQSRSVFLLLPNPKTGNFTTHTYYGPSPAGELSFKANSLLALTMKDQDTPVDVKDTDVSPTFSILSEEEKSILTRNQIKLLIALKAQEELKGILLLSNKLSGQRYSTEDRQLLKTICEEVSVGIENALAYESIQQEHGELLEAMDGIIHAMSLVVETRDPYTAGHQRRVADLAAAIARTMGLSEWAIRGIRVAGLLHDVGKLSVPSEILTKPGKLNQTEFDIIKSHSQVSYNILELIEFPWPVKQAILQHHERLDGSGYPDGLSGDDVILDARILGVADVVEAISSHRPYRPALGLEYAMKEITSKKGTLYDPKVVDACVKLFRDEASVLRQLQLPVAITS